jgi:hypothetical protein
MPINQSSFQCLFNDFFKNEEKIKKINKWCKNWTKLLSNIKVRLLHSKIYNPEEFKSVTLLVDGKDFVSLIKKNKKKIINKKIIKKKIIKKIIKINNKKNN